MISAKHHQVFHPDRGFLHIRVWSEGFAAGEPIPPTQTAFQWLSPALHGDWWRRDHIERFLADAGCPIDKEGVRVVPFPTCACCGHEDSRWAGEGVWLARGDTCPEKRQYRCARHRDRNPCAIEGCERTRAAHGRFADDQHLCSEHWRRFVPPRSATRRAYHRFWRIAKKTDWTPVLRRRFERFWNGLVTRARRQSVEGRLDMTEIGKMFGWGE